MPISTLALSLIKNLNSKQSRSIWVFPSPNDKIHISATAIDHALRRSVASFPNMEHFTPHDLRRTAASHITALGGSRLVVSKILNHIDNKVTAIYDRHSYDNEKKYALELWSKKLQDIIN